MAKSILTAGSIRKLIEKVWAENDGPIDFLSNSAIGSRTITEYLNVVFYTYKKTVKDDGRTFALVEAKDEGALVVDGADYAQKGVRIEFHVPAEKGDVLEYYVQKLRGLYLGKLLSLEKGVKAYLTFGALKYDRQPVSGYTGQNIVCSTDMTITYTTNVVMGGQRVWYLDGDILPYVSFNVDLDKAGVTNNLFELKATQTQPTTQSRFFRFSIPYLSDNDVCAKILRDILDGELEKIYELSYYDGVAYAPGAPFVVKTTLCRTSRSSGKAVADSDFDIWFTETDDGTTGNVLYEMALIDSPFDAGSINVRYFESIDEQTAWFDAKIAAGAPYAIIKAPNLNSLTMTQQVYRQPQGSNLDLNSLLTKNYAVIRATDRESGEVLHRYYYHITSASTGARGQIMVDLRMDSVQSYFFNPDLEIAPCVIDRAHLDRWVDIGSGKVKFNNGPDSPLFLTEGENLPKYNVHSNPISPGIDTVEVSTLNSRLEYYGWLLVYMKPNEVMDAVSDDEFKIPLFQHLHICGIDTGLYLLIAPLPHYNGDINVNGTYWSIYDLLDFINVYKLSPYVANMKITTVCPLRVKDHTGEYTFSGNNINITNPMNFSLNEYTYSELVEGTQYDGKVYSLIGDSPSPQFVTLRAADIHDWRHDYNKSDIVGAAHNPDLNPKTYSQNFREIRLRDMQGNSFTYDPQKLNLVRDAQRAFTTQLKVKFTESLTADITKLYLRIEGNNDTVYAGAFEADYGGLVSSTDASIPYSIDQLDAFLANNKNFFMQNQASRDQAALNSLMNVGMGVAAGAAMGGLAGAAAGLVGGAVNMANTALKDHYTRLNEQHTIDNMKAAPDDIRNAQGNVLWSGTINSAMFEDGTRYYFGCRVICAQATDSDIKRFDDYMHMNGFEYGRTGNIKEFSRTRKYFNFVQAEVNSIHGVSISDEAREDLRRRFSQGLRFWHSDEIQYELENYETWLEEGVT